MTVRALGLFAFSIGMICAASCGSNGSEDSGSGGSSSSTTQGGSENSTGGGDASVSGGSGDSGSAGAPSTGTNGGSAGDGASAGNGGLAGNGGSVGGSGQGAGGSGQGAGGTGTTGWSGAAGEGGGAQGPFDVEFELASDVDPEAPGTVGIVTFAIDAGPLTSAKIEFGLDVSYGMTAPVDVNDDTHRTLLLGMKPDRAYHFRIVAVAEDETYTSEDHVIETGPPTDLVSLSEFTVLDAEGREPGFFVTSFFEGDDTNVPFIIDQDGDIVWWYAHGPGKTMRARMSADGQNMWMVSPSNNGSPVHRVSMDCLDAETYSNVRGSHDITPVSGELMAFIEYGEEDCDSIFEIDPSGNTREVFESTGFVDEACHGNALRYSAAEDVYTFSDRLSDIFVMDREGTIEWRLSEIVPGGNATWGGAQHGHHLLEDSIVFFANEGGQSSSAVYEYTLAGVQLMFYDNGLRSRFVGDVQRLPRGNTLATYSVNGVIEEIDPDGKVVLRIGASSSRFGYVDWRPTLYGPPDDISR